jgi:hypothetical protein
VPPSVHAVLGEKHAGLTTKDTHDKLYKSIQSSEIPELDTLQLHVKMSQEFHRVFMSITCFGGTWGGLVVKALRY